MKQSHKRCLKTALVLFVIVLLAGNAACNSTGKGPINQSSPAEYFKIQVVDSKTGRGVPLVELRTVNNIRYYTDSNGIVAFREPGLMNREVFFFVESHGYEFPKDGFGFRGTRLKTVPGGSAVIKINRINIAERLYRITGQGIYRDSILTGHRTPLSEPVLNAQVVGQDSVFACIYKDRLFWMWGDTARASYPLGHFAMAGAVSELPDSGGLHPDVGVDYEYFVDKEGFSRPVAPLKEHGLVWLDGLMTVKDDTDKTRMVAGFARLKDLGTILERGLMVYSDSNECFEPLIRTGLDFLPFSNTAHAFDVDVRGQKYYYFTSPTPIEVRMRVKADWDHVTDPNAFEIFTALGDKDRKTSRWISYAKLTSKMQNSRQAVINALKKETGAIRVHDIETSDAIASHNGTVNYNPYRHKWVAIFVQHFGKPSMLGEVWYAEADTPVGPWGYARRIVTHDKYSFYNPAHHRFFDKENGRTIYFEGTYSHTFSGPAETATPRYDYNQIMYRLNLDDPRLALPVAVYKVRNGQDASEYLLGEDVKKARKWDSVEAIQFFAVEPDRSQGKLVGVHGRKIPTKKGMTLSLSLEPLSTSAKPLFYALPPTHKPDENSCTVFLYEYRHADTGQRLYCTDPQLKRKDWTRADDPLCCVWKTPPGPLLLDSDANPAPTN